MNVMQYQEIMIIDSSKASYWSFGVNMVYLGKLYQSLMEKPTQHAWNMREVV